MKRFQFFKPPTSIDKALKDLKEKPAAHWKKEGEETALRLFRFMAKTVPAYKSFLKTNSINPKKIRTIEDFQKLPIVDKKSYLKKFPIEDMLPNRDLSLITTFSRTSGSTGEPFYFPRGEEQDWQYEYMSELFLKNQFEIDKKKTLGMIGFGFGIWIGGVFTYKNFNKIAQNDKYSLALVPSGPMMEVYLKTVKKFGHLFDQVLLMGYPPFIKDALDQGKEYGIRWSDYNIKILTAAEGFSEKFRTYISKKAHLDNPLVDTLNIYGTVELGTMAHETPLTNLIRRIAVENKEVFKSIFPGAHYVPTLVQYHPYIIYFEESNGEVIGSGFGSSVPFVRYRFPDLGGVISFEEMISRLKGKGVDILKKAKEAGIDKMIMRLPFVYVYERSDFAIILRGANIYPEEIRIALHHDSLEDHLTGKFAMVKKETRLMNEYFEVNVELKKGAKPSRALRTKVEAAIVQTLRTNNSEYNDQYQSKPKTMIPKVTFWPYQHSQYFKPGTKQQWLIR